MNDAVWSPSGQLVAFTSHNSKLTIVDFNRGSQVQEVPYSDLPYIRLLFLSEQCLIAVGHGRNPTLFRCNKATGEWYVC